MSKATSALYAVHAACGRLLALVPAAVTVREDGVQLGIRPVAGPDQFVTEVQVPEELCGIALKDLVRDHDLSINVESKQLQARRRE